MIYTIEGYGERLKQAMKDRKLTVEKVEQMTGIPRQTIVLYRNERFGPGYYNLFWIAAETGLSVDWLMFGTGSMWRNDV